MWRWRPVDWIALVLVLVVAFVFGTIMVSVFDRDLEDNERDVLAGLIGALMTLLTVYLTHRLGKED